MNRYQKIAIIAFMLLIAFSSLQAITYWTDDFETDKGWVFSGNAQQTWVRGTPVGGSEVGPDPVGAFQGVYCIGNEMTAVGSYASSESSFAVSPAINCTGSGSVYVHFYHWLCTKGSSNTTCSLAVSNNGTTWTGVWGNPNPATDDIAWQYVSYDISAVASNRPTVYLRFRLKDSGASPPRHGGWNIDNIMVDNSPLAVNLSSFACSVRNQAVELSWRTESETGCYCWEIERSAQPGSGYRPVSSVPGHGTTTDPQSYAYTDALPEGAGTCWYRLAEVDLAGARTYHGPVQAAYGTPSGRSFQAGPAYPNPARAEVSISYQLPGPGRVAAAVYNALGQRVRTLAGVRQGAGMYAAVWDCRDDNGREAVKGVYFYQLQYQDEHCAAQGQIVVRRLVLVR